MKKMLVAVAIALVPVTASPVLAKTRLSSIHAAAAPENPDLICFIVWGHRLCW